MRKKLQVDIASTPDLPSGFTECEYLESSGTQWINTKLTMANLSFQIEWEALAGSLGNGAMVFGSEPLADGKMYGVVAGINNNGLGYSVQAYKSTINRAIGFYDVPPGTRAICEINLDKLYSFISVDGKGKIKRDIENTTQSQTSIAGLFSRQGGGIRSVARVFWLTANYAGQPAANFVPVLDAEGIPCMYDKISRQCFRNLGKGTFGYKIKATGETVAPKST